MSDRRTHRRRAAAWSVAAAAVAGLLVPVTTGPAAAEPDLKDVQTRVDRLYHQAEIVSERYNDIRAGLDDARDRLRALRADADRQQGRVGRLRRQIAADVVARYQGSALSTATQVLLSDDPDEFLSTLSVASAYDEQRAQAMRQFAVEARTLQLREAAAARQAAEIATAQKQLAARKREIEQKAQQADELLGRLKAEQRQAMADSARPAPQDVSGRAKVVVDYALAQVGKAYVWAAAGPSAYDCSGLTMMAWAQAGVSLPHSSSGQMSAGTPVSHSDLMPGDLVFYYSPVSHVGIYIGNGQIVDAANPSTGVRVASVDSMPYSGAVRPG